MFYSVRSSRDKDAMNIVEYTHELVTVTNRVHSQRDFVVTVALSIYVFDLKVPVSFVKQLKTRKKHKQQSKAAIYSRYSSRCGSFSRAFSALFKFFGG